VCVLAIVVVVVAAAAVLLQLLFMLELLDVITDVSRY
jgi:hypothetical protein